MAAGDCVDRHPRPPPPPPPTPPPALVAADTVFTRYIRPLTLLGVFVVYFHAYFFYPLLHDGKVLDIHLFDGVAEYVVIFYFGGRTVEKAATIATGKGAFDNLKGVLRRRK